LASAAGFARAACFAPGATFGVVFGLLARGFGAAAACSRTACHAAAVSAFRRSSAADAAAAAGGADFSFRRT
ncbi:MAG: hypothetical protein QOD30_1811, partial [Actinomycetota bacterium]|nr:hypothetical protein [Actinomycetota bacterium]